MSHFQVMSARRAIAAIAGMITIPGPVSGLSWPEGLVGVRLAVGIGKES